MTTNQRNGELDTKPKFNKHSTRPAFLREHGPPTPRSQNITI